MSPSLSSLVVSEDDSVEQPALAGRVIALRGQHGG